MMARDDARLGAPAPLVGFARLSSAVPDIAIRLRTFSAYADATVDRVLGPGAGGIPRLGAVTLDHLVFLNRGEHFDAVTLPREAQFAPAFHAGVADYDGDGPRGRIPEPDFPNEIQVPRYDAGRGLLLLGDGKGGLTPMPGQRSGIVVDQRGAAHRLGTTHARPGDPSPRTWRQRRSSHNRGDTWTTGEAAGPPREVRARWASCGLVSAALSGRARPSRSGYSCRGDGTVQVIGKAGHPQPGASLGPTGLGVPEPQSPLHNSKSLVPRP